MEPDSRVHVVAWPTILACRHSQTSLVIERGVGLGGADQRALLHQRASRVEEVLHAAGEDAHPQAFEAQFQARAIGPRAGAGEPEIALEAARPFRSQLRKIEELVPAAATPA